MPNQWVHVAQWRPQASPGTVLLSIWSLKPRSGALGLLLAPIKTRSKNQIPPEVVSTLGLWGLIAWPVLTEGLAIKS